MINNFIVRCLRTFGSPVCYYLKAHRLGSVGAGRVHLPVQGAGFESQSLSTAQILGNLNSLEVAVNVMNNKSIEHHFETE